MKFEKHISRWELFGNRVGFIVAILIFATIFYHLFSRFVFSLEHLNIFVYLAVITIVYAGYTSIKITLKR